MQPTAQTGQVEDEQAPEGRKKSAMTQTLEGRLKLFYLIRIFRRLLREPKNVIDTGGGTSALMRSFQHDLGRIARYYDRHKFCGGELFHGTQASKIA